MSTNNMVLWTEGLFLRSHHFQQQDRYHNQHLKQLAEFTYRNHFGFIDLGIDTELLKLGKVSLTKARGIFGDQTLFDFPSHGPAPLPLDVSDGCKEQLVFLCLPTSRASVPSVVLSTDENTAKAELCRFSVNELDVQDDVLGAETSIPMKLLQLKASLQLEDAISPANLNLPIAKIREKKPDGQVVLDDSFIPICLDIGVSKILREMLAEIHGLLKHRAIALANRMGQPNAKGVSEVTDFLLLQLCNRFEPLFFYYTQLGKLPAEELYITMLQLAGELSTYTNKDRLSPAFLPYKHSDQATCFMPVFAQIRKALTAVIDQTAVAIPLIDKGHGVHLADNIESSLIKQSTMVLAVFANVSTDQIRNVFPAQTKIGSTDKIRDLVMAQLPGISIKPMPVAPRQIPFYTGYTYFELDRQSDMWKSVEVSRNLVMHISGEFPGLTIELWAIRDK